MERMHVLLFVEFTKDFHETAMILKKISKELIDHGQDVTVVDTEVFDLLSVSNESEIYKGLKIHQKSIRASLEMAAVKECIVTCDAILFISPKNMPMLPKCVNRLIRNVNSVVLNRWCLQGVSCFVIAKNVKKAAVAQYIWKLLRKFESNGLHNALAPWKCYETGKMSNIQETPLPSI